jgi:3-isopropylmalate dehydrogenase
MVRMTEQITLLHGDGVDEEIRQAAVAVLDEVGDFTYREAAIGGRAMDVYDGDPFPPDTEELVRDSRIVLLGAVGGPKWASTDPDAPRPEDGLLRLRTTMGVHANLRPVFSMPSLPDLSPFRPEHTAGVNFMVVRELLGGSYFGEKGREGDAAFDTREYDTGQIEAIGRTGFALAQARSVESGEAPRVTSVDKANVLETSRLWRETITALQAAEYPDVLLDHMYVDNAAFQIGRNPQQFDVVLTENEHGDILSDESALFTGSLGLMPSASLDVEGRGIFEPVHGSAPDIAGQGIVNPTAMLFSTAMALKELGREEEANSIYWAVERAFDSRVLTPDLGGEATTEEFTQAVIHGIHGYAVRR